MSLYSSWIIIIQDEYKNYKERGNTMKRANIIVSILLIVIALILIPRIGTIKEAPDAILGPRFFPYIVLSLIILLSLIVLGMTFSNKEFINKEFINKQESMKVLITLGLFLAYIFALEKVGFVISTTIFLFVLGGFYYGKVNKVLIQIGIFSILSSLGLFYLFTNLFNVFLP